MLDWVWEIVRSLMPDGGYPNSMDVLVYYGQLGDYLGGVFGTILAAVTTVFVFLGWRATTKIDERSKLYQIFIEMLRTHEEIVSSMSFGDLRGREAISEVLGEFYAAYRVIADLDCALSPLDVERQINLAFIATYYGMNPNTELILDRCEPKFPCKELCKRLNAQRRTQLKEEIEAKLSRKLSRSAPENVAFRGEVSTAYHLIRSGEIPRHIQDHLRMVLDKAMKRGLMPQLDTLQAHIDALSSSYKFSGHQNRLSHYFRNIRAAFDFIEKSRLSRKEKRHLALVLKSKLLNYEQALLALYALSSLGGEWRDSKILSKYAPIQDIPEHFFSFDEKSFSLESSFPEVFKKNSLRQWLSRWTQYAG